MKVGAVTVDWRQAREIAWRGLFFVVAAGILIFVITRWTTWEGAPGWKGTDDAYLQSDPTPIAAKVPGYVDFIPVQDFQRVRAGQLVAQVVDVDYRATVAQAEANVAASTAQIETLKAQIELQKANVAAARAVVASTVANLDQNGRDLVRQGRLLQAGSSTTETGERLRTTHDQLNAQLAQNRAQTEAATRQIAVLEAQEQQAEATLAAQRAALATARINLAYTHIIAPVDGQLGQRQVRPGQYVGVGTQITTLIPLPRVWVVANYRETQLTHVVVGDKAEIRVDTFPSHLMKGHVQSLSPASGATFALLPPDNATGNFTKVVQRIAVKIVIDDADGIGDRLRPGMSVIAKVDAHDGRP
ncbi:MAG: HlyD family secretion protein [Caulobacteraceae bacterium]|nr:HlyD family secretion protein [Caulobacteraceae bacterium]